MESKNGKIEFDEDLKKVNSISDFVEWLLIAIAEHIVGKNETLHGKFLMILLKLHKKKGKASDQ